MDMDIHIHIHMLKYLWLLPVENPTQYEHTHNPLGQSDTMQRDGF
jgi:hypothetical protein